MNFFFNGFNAACLLFVNLTICVLLVLLFFVTSIILLFSSNIVNEVLGLFISNSVGVIWIKLYLFQMVAVLIFFLGEKRYHSNIMKLILSI